MLSQEKLQPMVYYQGFSRSVSISSFLVPPRTKPMNDIVLVQAALFALIGTVVIFTSWFFHDD